MSSYSVAWRSDRSGIGDPLRSVAAGVRDEQWPAISLVAPPRARGAVEGALSALEARDREALCLIAWEGLTPAEAAEVLGESSATFRVGLHRARRRFRALIENVREPITRASDPDHFKASGLDRGVSHHA